MKTYIDRTDPRLMDFVLGELDVEAARKLALALQEPENAEALEEVEALRDTVRVTQSALRTEVTGTTAALPESSRQVIREAVRRHGGSTQAPRKRYALIALAATVLLCMGAVVLIPVLQPGRDTTRLAMNLEHVDYEAQSLQRYHLGERERPQPLSEGDDVYIRQAPAALNLEIAEERTDSTQEVDQYSGRASVDAVAPSVVPDIHIRDVQTQTTETKTLSAIIPAERLHADEAPPMSQPILPPLRPIPAGGGERYTVIEERPFANAADQPLSTFSLHADGAAYANIRRILQQGQKPPRDAVRIEEIINYFDYDYPQPVGEHPFSVNIEVGPCPWASGHLLAKVGLQGRQIPKRERMPANLVFLIDTSGSMNRPNRLPLVKESLKALLEQLAPDDRVGIVTYAGESLTALASTPVSRKEDIVRTLDGLEARGSTHGSAGIQDAYNMAQKNFIAKGINRVILATDGDFNVGVTSQEGLLSLIEEKRRTGVFLTVLGYGMGNLKDATLELLATRGNGNYAYINDYSEARRVLVEQLHGTLVTIAKDTRIQVEFNPAHVRSYRLLGYENRMMADRDFHDDSKDAGEIGAGHTVTALYQIVPPGTSVRQDVDESRYQAPAVAPTVPLDNQAVTGEMMFVKLRYKQPDSDTSRLIEIPVTVSAQLLQQTSRDFRFAAAAAGFGLLLRDSTYKGDATYDLIRELAASATGNDQRREELLSLIVTAKTLH